MDKVAVTYKQLKRLGDAAKAKKLIIDEAKVVKMMGVPAPPKFALSDLWKRGPKHAAKVAIAGLGGKLLRKVVARNPGSTSALGLVKGTRTRGLGVGTHIMVPSGVKPADALGKVMPSTKAHKLRYPEKQLLSEVVKRHELEELRTIDKALKTRKYPKRFASHLGVQPMLNDLTMAQTLTGPGSKGVSKTLLKMRGKEVKRLKKQIPGLGRLGMGTMGGVRLNRHARKKIEAMYKGPRYRDVTNKVQDKLFKKLVQWKEKP